MGDRPTLTEVAARISAHLKRIENTPALNPYDRPGGCRRFYYAGAYRRGRFVRVTYVGYQGTSSLDWGEASRYLAWLDAGNVGTHFTMRRAPGTTAGGDTDA